MITIQNADKALKDYYLDAVCAQLNDGISPFYSAIEKSTNNVFGKDVKVAVVRGTCGNILAGAEDGDLPDPYKNRYLDITVPLKNLYGTIEISDKALRASKDNSGAFVNLVNAEMDGLVMSAKHNFQRMLFGNGSGRLGKIVKRINSKEYQLDTVKEYYTGLHVAIDDFGTPIINDCTDLYIASVDLAKSTVTFATEVKEAVLNGIVYIHGSKNNELLGLGAIFGDGAELYGYTKADEPYFKPYIVDNGAGALTENGLIEILDHMDEHFNSKINMILCSYKTRRMIAKLLADNRRVVNTTDVSTGFGGVFVNGIPVYADKFCAEGQILFVNTDDFCLNQLCDWEWLEDESGKILKQIPGKPAYSATLVKYAELICKKPCGQAMLKNFTEAGETVTE